MRILITGGAGFIGSNLALSLRRAGYEVTVLDSLSPQIHGDDPRSSTLFRSIEQQVRFIEGSVTDADAWARALPGQQAIVHLAAETGTGQSMYEMKRYCDVNVGGTALMLEALAGGRSEVRKIVVASSRALYGEGKYGEGTAAVYPLARKLEDLKQGRFDLYASNGEPLRVLPTDEESAIHPSSVYGITKHAQEQLVMTVAPSLGVAATALRYQNVYGPGQSLSNPYTGILSIFSTRILHGKPIRIFEDGEESRDFVYIDDVVRATQTALLHAAADNEIIGIGSGVPTTVAQAARALQIAYGKQVETTITGEFRLGDIRHNYADLSKALRLLDYSPAVDFQAGIRRFVEWVKTQPLQNDRYEHSLREMKSKGLMHG